MKPWIPVAGTLLLAGCVEPPSQPRYLMLSPSTPRAVPYDPFPTYLRDTYPALPPLPAPLPAPAQDFEPIAIAPAPTLAAPEPPASTEPPTAAEPPADPAPATPVAVQKPPAPETGGAVPLMGFRPMRGQKPPGA